MTSMALIEEASHLSLGIVIFTTSASVVFCNRRFADVASSAPKD